MRERGEQLVHVVLWLRAYSPRIAYVGVSLVWPSQGGGLGLELSVQQPETGNRWGEDPGLSLRGFIFFSFYFSHVQLAVFSCSGCFHRKSWFDLTPVFSFALHASSLHIFLLPFFSFFHFICNSSSLLPFIPPLVSSHLLNSLFISSYFSFTCCPLLSSSIPSFSNLLSPPPFHHIFIFSSPPSSSATPALILPSLSPHTLSSLTHSILS